MYLNWQKCATSTVYSILSNPLHSVLLHKQLWFLLLFFFLSFFFFTYRAWTSTRDLLTQLYLFKYTHKEKLILIFYLYVFTVHNELMVIFPCSVHFSCFSFGVFSFVGGLLILKRANEQNFIRIFRYSAGLFLIKNV